MINQLKKIQRNRGMTYVELIVVLSIFSVLSTVVIYNYGTFQSKVDIKNVSSDVALKIVEAQKTSLSGLLPAVNYSASWKPSYGLYFNITSDKNIDNKSFIYFADLNNDDIFDGSNCNGTAECLQKILITKGNYISSLDICYASSNSIKSADNSGTTQDTNSTGGTQFSFGVDLGSTRPIINPPTSTKCQLTPVTGDLTVTFARPSSGAAIVSGGQKLSGVSYAQITIASPSNPSASTIKIYPSGRIQVN